MSVYTFRRASRALLISSLLLTLALSTGHRAWWIPMVLWAVVGVAELLLWSYQKGQRA